MQAVLDNPWRAAALGIAISAVAIAYWALASSADLEGAAVTSLRAGHVGRPPRSDVTDCAKAGARTQACRVAVQRSDFANDFVWCVAYRVGETWEQPIAWQADGRAHGRNDACMRLDRKRVCYGVVDNFWPRWAALIA